MDSAWRRCFHLWFRHARFFELDLKGCIKDLVLSVKGGARSGMLIKWLMYWFNDWQSSTILQVLFYCTSLLFNSEFILSKSINNMPQVPAELLVFLCVFIYEWNFGVYKYGFTRSLPTHIKSFKKLVLGLRFWFLFQVFRFEMTLPW